VDTCNDGTQFSRPNSVKLKLEKGVEKGVENGVEKGLEKGVKEKGSIERLYRERLYRDRSVACTVAANGLSTVGDEGGEPFHPLF
jgi:hypothetical protein